MSYDIRDVKTQRVIFLQMIYIPVICLAAHWSLNPLACQIDKSYYQQGQG